MTAVKKQLVQDINTAAMPAKLNINIKLVSKNGKTEKRVGYKVSVSFQGILKDICGESLEIGVAYADGQRLILKPSRFP
ncbi:MAG: hypothetical protein Q8R39_00680 [bacterium]|nr:hypothetical protein [bacterium]